LVVFFRKRHLVHVGFEAGLFLALGRVSFKPVQFGLERFHTGALGGAAVVLFDVIVENSHAGFVIFYGGEGAGSFDCMYCHDPKVHQLRGDSSGVW
jgi:hypothetical protein